MKSWENLEADENLILATHMTKGRQGCKVDKIVVHHNGGNLTGKGCYDTWQTREASAHYQVAADGRITQLVCHAARLGYGHRMAYRRLAVQPDQHRRGAC